MIKKLCRVFVVAALLSGCATRIQGPNYLTVEPSFDLFQFFDGSVKAWGLVQNRSGELVQRFEVDIKGTVEGDRLTLDEQFYYAVGEGVAERTWVIERQSDGTYVGDAGDILGSAQGQSFGNAFHWSYRMAIPVAKREIEVAFEDWFWAIDDRRLLNRSYLQKLGFDVAEVTIFMERVDGAAVKFD